MLAATSRGRPWLALRQSKGGACVALCKVRADQATPWDQRSAVVFSFARHTHLVDLLDEAARPIATRKGVRSYFMTMSCARLEPLPRDLASCRARMQGTMSLADRRGHMPSATCGKFTLPSCRHGRSLTHCVTP
jgi:hypothetical protein